MLTEEGKKISPPPCDDPDCTYDPEDPELESVYAITYGLRPDGMTICHRGTMENLGDVNPLAIREMYRDLSEVTEELLMALMHENPIEAINVLVEQLHRMRERKSKVTEALEGFEQQAPPMDPMEN